MLHIVKAVAFILLNIVDLVRAVVRVRRRTTSQFVS